MVNQITVWVRIPSIPIKYYDRKVLTFNGNRIRKDIKVYRRTLIRERGKYAWLCIQVDLNKPLLALFAIKFCYSKVEYEGLHLLCLQCGIYGHSAEGCGTQMIVETTKKEGTKTGDNGQISSEAQESEQEPNKVRGLLLKNLDLGDKINKITSKLIRVIRELKRLPTQKDIYSKLCSKVPPLQRIVFQMNYLIIPLLFILRSLWRRMIIPLIEITRRSIKNVWKSQLILKGKVNLQNRNRGRGRIENPIYLINIWR